jgi:REP element-mobilizing transposase RayT
MPRHKTILQNKFPYHITGRCINKDWFELPMQEVWNIFSEELYMAHILHDLKIHSFVLMNNHYHLIASTPKSNLSVCMQRFSQRVSVRITKSGKRINQTFAGRYYKTVLQSPNYYLNCYKYIYRNPVEAGICEKAELYPYSTLSEKLGLRNLTVPIEFDDTLFEPRLESCLDWINQKPSDEKIEAIRYALKRPKFKSPKCKITSALILSENDCI